MPLLLIILFPRIFLLLVGTSVAIQISSAIADRIRSPVPKTLDEALR